MSKNDVRPDGVDIPEVEELLPCDSDLTFFALNALQRLVFQGKAILGHRSQGGIEPLSSLE